MYRLEGNEEILTRLCWNAGRKAFVYCNSNGELVCTDSTGSRNSLNQDGEVTCLAINREGNACAIALDGTVSEHDANSGDKLDSLLNGKGTVMTITHMQYDSNGSNL